MRKAPEFADIKVRIRKREDKKEQKKNLQVSTIPQTWKGTHKSKKVIYIDVDGVNWNDPASTVQDLINTGFNVINFAFYLDSGPTDFAAVWGSLSQSDQIELINTAHAQNVILLVSAGGSTSIPYPSEDPVAYATVVCNWVIANNLDGCDYDIENIAPDFPQGFYTWWNSLLTTSRSILGSERYISIAPEMPYLSVPNTPGSWTGALGGLYNTVTENPDCVDFLNCQFYNEAANYTTYQECFINSGQNFPGSAIQQLHNSGKGIPLYKFVFGTYLLSTDGAGGISDPTQLNTAFQQAQENLKWTPSVMVWQYHSLTTAQAWLRTVFGTAS
jgi:chitinase